MSFVMGEAFFYEGTISLIDFQGRGGRLKVEVSNNWMMGDEG